MHCYSLALVRITEISEQLSTVDQSDQNEKV